MSVTTNDINLRGMGLAAIIARSIPKPSGITPLSLRSAIPTYTGGSDYLLTPEGFIYRKLASTQPVDSLRVFASNDPSKRWILIGTVQTGASYNIAAFKQLSGSWTAAFQSFFASGEKALSLGVGSYDIETTLFPNVADGFVLSGVGPGASVLVNQAGNVAMFDVRGLRQPTLRDFTIRGSGLGTGVLLNGSFHAVIRDVTAQGLNRGFDIQSVGINTIQASNAFVNCKAIANTNGGFTVGGTAEYTRISGCLAEDNGNYGIYCSAGNPSITDNDVNNNQQGILIEGNDLAALNPDHGKVQNNRVKHNHVVGISLLNTFYSMLITGNDIWATLGPGNINQDYRGSGTTPGLWIEGCENITATDNCYAHNRLNIGVKGLKTSKITGSAIANSGFTATHYREFAGKVNAQNEVELFTDGTQVGGQTQTFFPLLTTESLCNTYQQKSSTSSRTKTLTTGSPSTYFHTGEVDALTLKSNYAGQLSFPPLLWEQKFDVFVHIITGFPSVTASVPGAALTSLTSACTIASSVATFTATGIYHFYPTASGAFTISLEAGAVTGGSAPIDSPPFSQTFTGALQGTEFTHPAGYMSLIEAYNSNGTDNLFVTITPKVTVGVRSGTIGVLNYPGGEGFDAGFTGTIKVKITPLEA